MISIFLEGYSARRKWVELTHRERVLKALKHEEPDRVPIDLGSTPMTGISAVAYNKLKNYLAINTGEIKVWDIFQQLAVVEESILEWTGADILPVNPGMPRNWKQGRLPDGTPCKFPENYNPETQQDGSQLISNWPAYFDVTIRMPEGGLYYITHHPLDKVKTTEDLKGFDWRYRLSEEGFTELKEQAKLLYENTDYALMGGSILGGNAQIYEVLQNLRGWDTFLIDLMTNQKLAEYMLDKKTEAAIEWFDKFIESVGNHVQIIQLGDDLGTQTGLQISPELYRKLLKPRHKRLWEFIKSRTKGYLWMHNCGSVYELIPDFIELGIDILNPVQVSAANMDTGRLKKEFGKEIVFWGGGCDTQNVLPNGTPNEVKDEVKRRMDDLAPGGGFVFSQVMNILQEVPTENIVAMFETVAEYGRY